jgi:hypothetical protein
VENEGGPLDRIVVTASSPDALIMAKLSHRNQISLRMRPGAYGRYRVEELQSQLAQLATKVWAENRREYFRSASEALGQPVRGDETTQDPKVARFKRAQAELPVSGRSSGGAVEIRSVGLMRWQFTIRPDALRRLDERQFLTEVATATRELLVDYFDRVRALKDEIFDLRIPKARSTAQRRGERRQVDGQR